MPLEYARFDINIAPLEVGNVYCEAKSALKFHEAALVEVPTFASPTRPFVEVIEEGVTGMLARGEAQWYAKVTELVVDEGLRRTIALAAKQRVLVEFGPAQRSQMVIGLVLGLIGGQAGRSQNFARSLPSSQLQQQALPDIPAYETVLEAESGRAPSVAASVVADWSTDALIGVLDSIRDQALADIDLVIVVGSSGQCDLAAVTDWLTKHADRFAGLALLRTTSQAGLARSRNLSLSYARTPYVFLLDATTRLRPDCLEMGVQEIEFTGASIAYPAVLASNDRSESGAQWDWSPEMLRDGRYLRGAAIVRSDCWLEVGGYEELADDVVELDFCLKLVERGFFGVRLPAGVEHRQTRGALMSTGPVSLDDVATAEILSERHPWINAAVVIETREALGRALAASCRST